jgi:hypothetical protein
MLTRQEIVFWISLFIFDIGVPLMLPERWRFQIGATLTALSMLGLYWSLFGYRMTRLPPNLGGWRSLVLASVVVALASFLSRIRREPRLAAEIDDVADEIRAYVRDDIDRRLRPDILHTLPDEWRKTVGRYNRLYGRRAASLVREVRATEYLAFARQLTEPTTVMDFNNYAVNLTKIGGECERWRLKRFAFAGGFGALLGALAFGIVYALGRFLE